MSRSHFQSQHRSPHHGRVSALAAGPLARLRHWAAAALGVLALGVTCAASGQTPLNKEPIKPLPTLESLNLNPGKIRLGEKLFKDPRLSKDNTISCSSCHLLDKGGANPKKFSIGIREQTVPVN